MIPIVDTHHADPGLRAVGRASAECGVLQAIAASFDADASCLYEIDRRLNAGDHRLFNLDPDSLQLYRLRFARSDPLHPRSTAPLGVDVVRLSDVVDRDRLARSEYFRQFMQPFGMQDEIEIVLRSRGRPVAGISLIRAAGRPPFSSEAAARVRAALPMIRLLLLDDTPSIGPAVQRLMTETYGLTDRELEIAQMLRQGRTNKVIAERLCISLSTVKTHVHRVLAKVGVASRAELVAAFFVR